MSKKFLGNISMSFREVYSQFHKFRLSAESSKEYMQNIEETLLFIDYWLDSINREKMEHLFPQHHLFLRNSYCNNDALQKRKTFAWSRDGDTDFFDIFSGVFQRNTLAPSMIILCKYNVLRTLIDLVKKYRNYDRRRLHIGSRTSPKYYCPKQIPAVYPGEKSWWYWPICEPK